MPYDNDLVERYLYAVTRRLPAKQRADVAEELRTLVFDMLDERCGTLPPTQKDVRVVLTELGTPGEMVRKYTADEDACLIGQPYYAQYLLVLKIVLACVVGGITLASALTVVTGAADDGLLKEGLGWFGSIIGASAFAFTFVTVLFAVFHRKGVQVEVMGSLDDLPPVPRGASSTRGEAVVGIVFSIIFAAVFLLFPDILNALSHRADGVPFDPFNIEAIRASAWILVAWTLVCVAGESFKLVEGRYTKRAFVVSLVANVAAAALTVFWLANYQIIDSQAIVQAFASTGEAPEGFLLQVLSNVQPAFCGLVVVALAIDTVSEAVKTFQGR